MYQDDHISILIFATVVTCGILLHTALRLQSWSNTLHPILEQLQKECPTKDIIMCINDNELSVQLNREWVGQIRKAYASTDEFGSALLTLKSVHDVMTQNPQLTLAGLNEALMNMNLSWMKVLHDIQEKMLTEFRSDIKKTNDRMNNLYDTAVLNHTKMKEALWKHTNQIGNFEEMMQTLSNDVRTQITALENVNVKVDKNKEETDQLRTVNEDLKKIRGNLSTQNNRMNNLNDTAVLNHTKMKAALSRQTNQIRTFEKVIQTMSNDVRTHINALEEVNVKVDQNKDETDKVNGHLKEFGADLGTQKAALSDLSGKVDDYHKDTEATFSEHNSRIKYIEDKAIPVLEKDVASQQSDKKDLESKQQNVQFKQSVNQELIDEIRSKTVFHDVSFYLGLISIGCCLWMFWSSREKKQTGCSSDINTTSRTQTEQREHILPRHRDNIDVYQLKWKGSIENSVCVITFYSETEQQHTTEAKSVFQSDDATLPVIHTRAIRRHADIKGLPGSRIFLVFIDFNDRNVILEDPNKDLADLRVTTVRCLWTFGGDVTVIYCGDQGSRQLGGELFNRDLSSINRQPELSKLKTKRRMLSIFDGFSDYQKEHCRGFINRQLNRD